MHKWLCHMLRLGLPEQAMGCYPLGLGLVVEDKSFMYIYDLYQ